jgi:hypothetical protein
VKFTNDRLPNAGDKVYITYGDNLTLVGTVKVYNPGTVVNTGGFLDVLVEDGTGDQIVLTLSQTRNFKVTVTTPTVEERLSQLPIGTRFKLSDAKAGYYIKVSDITTVFVNNDGSVTYDSFSNTEDFFESDESFEVIE